MKRNRNRGPGGAPGQVPLARVPLYSVPRYALTMKMFRGGSEGAIVAIINKGVINGPLINDATLGPAGFTKALVLNRVGLPGSKT